jgi:hypothetical protein
MESAPRKYRVRQSLAIPRPGDAPGTLTKDITNSFDNEGKPLKWGLK